MSEFSIYYCHSSTFFFSIFLVLGPLDPSLLSPAWLLLQTQNRPQIRPKLAENYGLNVVTQSLAFSLHARGLFMCMLLMHCSSPQQDPHGIVDQAPFGKLIPAWPSITAFRLSRERGSPTCRPA